MTDQPTGDPTHGLSVQHADALWDAVAIPGPTAPTFPMQHERVCRAVAEILAELTPTQPAVPVASPPPDQTAEPACKFEEGCHRVVPCDPGCGTPPPDQTLRDRIAEAVQDGPTWMLPRSLAEEVADEVLAVLPPPADRAAVFREAADGFDRHAEQILDGVGNKAVFVAKALRDQAAVWREAAETLRRLAAEAQQPDTETQPEEVRMLRLTVDAIEEGRRELRADNARLRAQLWTLAAIFEGFGRLLATSSRDWGQYAPDAWLYAVICGWDCERPVHDETCTHGVMEEMQQRHGWDAATVAKARRYRAVVHTFTAPAVPEQPATDCSEPPVHKGGNADDCPACIAGGLDTIGPPYECPEDETATSSEEAGA